MKKAQSISPFIASISIMLLIILPLFGLPVTVPGIPVWYQDTFFIALICGGGVGLLSLLLSFTGVYRKVRWNGVDGMALIILIYSLVRLSFQEMIPQVSWIQLIFFGGLYFLGRILFRQLNEKSINLLIAAVLLAGIGESVYGLGQLYGIWKSHHAAFPITGSFFNPGPYSGWLACIVPVAVWTLMIVDRDARWRAFLRVLGIVFLFLAAGVLIPAASRAAWLAAGVGSVMIGGRELVRRYKFLFRSAPRRKLLSWILQFSKAVSKWIIGTIVIAIFICLYYFKKDSADSRLLIWKVSTEIITDYPLFGVGWDRFPVIYNRYQAEYFNQGKGTENEIYLAEFTAYAYNELLGFLIEMGFVGGILLLFMVVMIYWRKRKYRKVFNEISEYRMVLSILVGWILFSCFSYPTEVPALGIFGVLIFAALSTLYVKVGRRTDISIYRYGTGFITLLIILSSSVYSLYWVHIYRPVSKEWVRACKYYQEGYYVSANSVYLRLEKRLKKEGFYLTELGKSLSQAREFYQSAFFLEHALYFSSDPVIYTTLGKDYTLFRKVDLNKAKRAEEMLNYAKYMQPGHYFPRYLLMELYKGLEKNEKLTEEASDILALKIKVDTEAVQEIRMKAWEVLNVDPFKVGVKGAHQIE